MSRLRTRVVVASAVAAATLIGMPSRPAWAIFGVCRTDPQVHFANGLLLDVRTHIQEEPTVVGSISFIVHAPRGQTVTSTVTTGAPGGVAESVQVVPDSADGYSVETLAVSRDGSAVPVSVTVHVAGRGSVWSTSDGMTGTTMVTTVAAP